MQARSNADIKRINNQLFVLEQAPWITPDVSIVKATRNPVPLGVVQRALPPSTVILEYVLDNPHSYCLVISKAGARIVRLPASETIERDVVAFLKNAKAKKAETDRARALYKHLLQPVREITENANLVVVRDGELHLLPFDALIDGAGSYVAESKVVSYVNSASSFSLLRRPGRARSQTPALLGVGGVPYDAATVRRGLGTRGYETSGLNNLPESKNEVMAAAKAVSSASNTLLLGLAATESAFKREQFRKYRVLHLAVHGLANTSQPDRAALVMLSDPAAGEDGFLQASEVVHLKMNADLVVLSACDTAIGPIAGEEGIATLSRAFLLAGARTVVSTLWSIEDQASLVLMRQFYTHLAAHMSADRALAEAKRDIIKKFGRNAPPYYWAAFTLEGSGDLTTL
jgi:CHAT domain-containing protein